MIERVDSFTSLADLDISSLPTQCENITEHPEYKSGTADWPHLSADFAQHAEKGLHSALDFISQQSNPNQVTGMFSNALSFIKDHQMALNRNCTYCSKAVDQNLASLAKGTFDNYFVATETAQGSISTDVKNVHSEILDSQTPLSDKLGDLVSEGDRAIIVVPVKDKGYSHAMNFIHHSNGSAVIDGQFHKVYNFNNPADREKFDSKYGVGSQAEHKPPVVTVWRTGESPVVKDEPFEIIEQEDKSDDGWLLV